MIPNSDASFMKISAVISNMEAEVDEVGTNIDTLLSDSKDTKTYDELSKSNFAKVYAKVVDEYYYIGSSLAKISLNLIDIRTLKRQLQQGVPGIMPSVEKSIRTRLEFLIKNYENLRDGLSTLKDVYEAKLRFYQSCQYIMTGSKFTDRS